MFGKSRPEYETVKNESGVTLTRWSGKNEDLTVPAEIDGAKLTEIGENAFYDLRRLKSVVLPDGVKRIGAGAFKGCASLKKVHLPALLTELGDYAFSSCKELEEIALPVGLKKLSQGCFYKCRSLTRMVLGDKAEEIGDEAFYGCASLKYLSLGENVKKIGENALKGLHEQLCLVIPSGMQKVDPKLGELCDRLYRREAQGLELLVYAGHETKLVLDDEVNGETVTAIGPKVFSMFAYLETLKLPSRLVSIGDGAFMGCSSLEELILPPTLKTIGRGAFTGCGAADGVPGYVRLRRGDMATYGGIKSLVLPEGLESVGDNAFAGCVALQKIEIKGKDTYLGAGCFSMTGIESFYFPENASEIQSELLRGCVRLKKVYIPEGVESIWERAFEGCAALESLRLPQSLEVIGGGAFASMASLKELLLPAKVREIGEEAFAFTPALEKMEIEEGCARYAVEDGCLVDRQERVLLWVPAGKKGEFAVPGSIERIGACAFAMSELSGVTLGPNVKSLGDWAFRAGKIKKLKIQNPDIEIGNNVLLDAAEIEIEAEDGVIEKLFGEKEEE